MSQSNHDATQVASHSTSEGLGPMRANNEDPAKSGYSLDSTSAPLAQDGPTTPMGSLRSTKKPSRPELQSKASTALSLADIYTQPHGDHHDQRSQLRQSRGRAASAARKSPHLDRLASRRGSDADDTASLSSVRSVSSFAQEHEVESLVGDDVGHRASIRHPQHESERDRSGLDLTSGPDAAQLREYFEHEFDDLEELVSDGSNEESLMVRWRCKLKHFLILSSAGKPIYSRHGDDQLISNSIGVIQTIISYFLDAEDTLQSFTAAGAQFAILSKGHLHLVAISRLTEDDTQLRTQLDALYMQILSSLTLPIMQRMFINRPSTDLRRSLGGTDSLISALSDDFTRGSPSSLLSALECLKLRKTQREVVNQTMLKYKSPSLLYGLIVAGGRLVSVVRPKKHSLHPGDLQLIFNMLFKASSVRASGGENWIPLCLPGFNNTGYIYMYVSFLDVRKSRDPDSNGRSNTSGAQDDIVIVLISAKHDSLDELRDMRDSLVDQLEKNGSLPIIRSSVLSGRPSCTDIVPGTVIRHFLYKSRANVQFVMPDAEDSLRSPLAWRCLMSIYAPLHASMHGKTSHLKIHHATTKSCISLAWVTPTFEMYCVASPTVSRDELALSASKFEQWARKEQERLFIIGGAVF